MLKVFFRQVNYTHSEAELHSFGTMLTEFAGDSALKDWIAARVRGGLESGMPFGGFFDINEATIESCVTK